MRPAQYKVKLVCFICFQFLGMATTFFLVFFVSIFSSSYTLNISTLSLLLLLLFFPNLSFLFNLLLVFMSMQNF